MLAAALLLPALATSCSSGAEAGGDRPETLTVLAASSLTDAFSELEQTFESQRPEVQVRLIFDSSSTLAEQVLAGAPADVLATADEATMRRVVDARLTAAEPATFARNQLTMVTPAGNPADVQSVADIDRAAVTYAVCVPDAPCGAASAALLDRVGVRAQPVTEEDNVRAVLTKVAAGEVDAGLVYVSDAEAAGSHVVVVDVPQADQVLNADRIAALSDADDPALAAAWVDLVTSAEGQRVLESHGFLPGP